MPNLSQFLSIEKHSKNDVPQSGTAKNPATPLHSETTKCENGFEKKSYKNVKTTKQPHTYKSYASTYNVDILNSSNAALQLENIESAMKNKPNIY